MNKTNKVPYRSPECEPVELKLEQGILTLSDPRFYNPFGSEDNI